MKQRDILFILISSVILTIAWIAFNLIHNGISSTISGITNQQITTIKPNFDTQTINELKKRQGIEPQFNAGTAQISSGAAVPASPTPIPTLKPFVFVSTIPQATQGGTPTP